MEKTIAMIRGDGIGPEIVEQAIAVLDTAAKKFGHSFCYTEAPMGGCAIDEFGVPLPESSRQICLASDSVLLGAVGGYPVGARTVGQLRAAGLCGREEGECLLTCCNNAGPAFIFGVAGLGCFGSLRAGAALYAIHIGSAALVGLLHRRRGGSSAGALPAAIRMRPSQALIDAVQSAAGAMVQVCAFVVFFLVALRLLTGLTGWSHPALLGFFELTNGILRLPPTRAGFVWAAALLGWGGLSVHCQTAAVLRGAGLSLRPYLRGKALQAALSAATAAFTAQWIL